MRLVIYPFASYVCFRFTYKLSGSDIAIDPWYLYQNISIQEVFEWTPEDVPMFTIHISCGFLAYFFSWIACFMTLHRSGLVFPTLAATPVSVVVFVCMAYFKTDIGFKMDMIFQADPKHLWLMLALAFSAFLWIGQIMITAYPMWSALWHCPVFAVAMRLLEIVAKVTNGEIEFRHLRFLLLLQHT